MKSRRNVVTNAYNKMVQECKEIVRIIQTEFATKTCCYVLLCFGHTKELCEFSGLSFVEAPRYSDWPRFVNNRNEFVKCKSKSGMEQTLDCMTFRAFRDWVLPWERLGL